MAAKEKRTESIVSAMGALLQLVVSWVKAIQDLGAEVGAVTYWLARPAGQTTLAAMAKVAVEAYRVAMKPIEAITAVVQKFALTVNYATTLSSAITAGKYDWVDPNITQEHFPAGRADTTLVEAEMVHLDKELTTSEVEAELTKRGYRPGDLRELLDFGARNPDAQREFPVVALGSSWLLGSCRFCTSLYGFGAERHLNLPWAIPRTQWNSACRFLAVRLSPGPGVTGV